MSIRINHANPTANLRHISASNCERRGCVLLTGLLDVVHVEAEEHSGQFKQHRSDKRRCQSSCLWVSHVALSQSFVNGQQAGDLLDDDLPGQFDGTVAVVRSLSLRLKAAGFLTRRRRDGQTGGGGERQPARGHKAPPD